MRSTRVHVVASGLEDTDPLFESFDTVRVTTASDAAALVEAGTDCVVVDGSREDRGLAIIDAVRAVDRSVPVVLTTADPNGCVAAAGTRAGATEYVVRNVPDEPSLVDRVGALVADRSVMRSGPDPDPDLDSSDERTRGGPEPEPEPAECERGRTRELERRTEVLGRLQDIISEPGTSFADRLDRLLVAGRSSLDVEYAALSRIDGDQYEFVVVSGEDDAIEAGDTLALSESYCDRIVHSGESLGFRSVTEQRPGLVEHDAFEQLGISCFLGAPVRVGDGTGTDTDTDTDTDSNLWGTLCFFSRRDRSESFTEWERTVVELLADWIGHELEHERRRREIEQTHESLERAVERIDDAFFALDEEWRFTFVNEQVGALIRTDPADLLEKRLWDVFPKLVGTTFEEQYRRAMDEQESVTFEEYFPPLEGWFEVVAYPSESGLSVSVSDVTERKEMERELRESEAKFRQFTENLEEVVWMSSVEIDEIHYVNPAYEDLWGRSRQSVYDDPMSFLEGIHPDDRQQVLETIPRRARGEYDEEFRVVRPDGTVRWVRDRATPIHDEDGAVFRVVGIAEDITERKVRERELKRYERIIETIGDGVVIVDADQRVAHVNEACTDILGIECDDLIGTHASSLVDDETWDEWTTVARKMAAGERTHATIETDLPTEDGTVPVEAHATVLTAADRDEDEFVWIGRDITERREREQTVRRLLETTQALFACEGPEDVANVVVDAASEVFGYEYVGVRLYDAETDCLVLEAATDSVFEDVTDRDHVAVEPGTSPTVEAFTRGEAVVIDDIRTASPHDYGKLRGAMCIPLADAGVLAVGSPTDGAFDHADVQLAQLLTTSAGAALESATRQAALVRHEQVLETVEGMVYAVDDEATFTIVTEPFAARLGYDRETLLGEHVSIVLEDEDIDRGTETIRQLLADPRRESTTFETTFHTADGDEFPAEIEISLLPSDGTFRGTVGAVRDITERKERERYLQVLNRVLRHNLRNDLTVVLGYADRLANEVDDELVQAATTLYETAADLADLSEDAKRIEHVLRRGRVDGRPVSVAAVATDVLERSGDGWADASIDLDVPDDVAVRADDQLSAVLASLVDNAVEHTPHEEPRVRIRARADVDTVTLSVEDDGPGIPRHEREIITGDRDITQLSHGSGLGLWLVRWIVDSYGGEVAFHRSELGGSRVAVTLERARLEASS
ncbi:PAS domain S-box protein [Natronoglomus mannanivorans]|uniref:histidine kinase n=1 Tax=Natronoglomus mannanivorans TaxID=2979990 RepID=A0AAP2Z210_9EURY|nr:PAS domain S-box protein [Halobacteria archaeon AArc-xg1-1]